MRTLCKKLIVTALSLFSTIFVQSTSAKLIFGINDVTVTERLTTNVEFDQDELRPYGPTDNLKLRVMENNTVLRQDLILNKHGHWIWNKVLPFSEDLKLVILKGDTPISEEYFADTKNRLLAFSKEKSELPMIRNIYRISPLAVNSNVDKKRLSISLPKELATCKEKMLVVVFDRKTNELLWQFFGVLQEGMMTHEIDVSENTLSRIVLDDSSCNSDHPQ